MPGSARHLLIAIRAAVVAGAALASQVQAQSKETEFPRKQHTGIIQYGAHPAELGKSGTTGQQTAQPGGQISIGLDGQLVGAPRYASREKVGDTMIVTFVATPPPDPDAGSGKLPTGLPVSGRLSSPYGYRIHPILGGERLHRGIDIAAPTGTPIQATSNGRVEMAGRDGGYGLMVKLDDGGGIETLYGHMSRLAVAKGEIVHEGDVLGYVGSTGLSTGPHVHYEIRQNGRSIDPARTESSKR